MSEAILVAVELEKVLNRFELIIFKGSSLCFRSSVRKKTMENLLSFFFKFFCMGISHIHVGFKQLSILEFY